jgi:hypothetical protein
MLTRGPCILVAGLLVCSCARPRAPGAVSLAPLTSVLVVGRDTLMLGRPFAPSSSGRSRYGSEGERLPGVMPGFDEVTVLRRKDTLITVMLHHSSARAPGSRMTPALSCLCGLAPQRRGWVLETCRVAVQCRPARMYHVRYLGLRHAAMVGGMVAIVGCSDLFDLSGPAITVSFDVQPVVATAFVLRSDIGGRRVELAADPARGGHATIEARGERYGNVPVRVTMLTAAGDSVATMWFSQEFQRGYHHWVAARVGPQRPVGLCVGTALAAPVSAGSADSVYVMYGGIPDGAVC